MRQYIIGIFFILLGLAGLLLGLGGGGVGLYFIDQATITSEQTLDVSLRLVNRLTDDVTHLEESTTELAQSMQTLEQATLQLHQTLTDTVPLVDDMAQIVVVDIPFALDDAAITTPELAQTAVVIDETLYRLSEFEIDQRFLGFVLQFDLGIEYEQNDTLAQSINDVGTSLSNVAANFRLLESDFKQTKANLSQLSQQTQQLALDVSKLSAQIETLPERIATYNTILMETRTLIKTTKTQMVVFFSIARIGLIIGTIWFCLLQTIPIYLGWHVMREQHQ